MAVAPTFWTSNNIIDATQWPTATQPYQILPGSGVDLLDPQIWQDAETLFPFFDGDNNSHVNFAPTLPDNYATAGGAEFARWHSAHQLAYLKDPSFQQTATVPDDGADTGLADVRYVTFTDGVTAVLSVDGDRVYILNNLTPTEIARMSLEDQRAVVAAPGFQTLVAAPYSLVPDTVTGYAIPPNDAITVMATPEAARAGAMAVVDELRAVITASPSYQAGERDTFLGDPTRRGDLYHYFFLEQLDLYALRLDAQAIFNLDRIKEDIEEITDRYIRFERYSSVTDPVDNGSALFPSGMNSTDSPSLAISNTDTIGRGVDVFLRAESTLWEKAVQKSFTVQTGLGLEFSKILRNIYDAGNATFYDYKTGFGLITLIGNPATIEASKLDGAGILSTLQILENYEKEAEAEALSEELNQIDRLLKDYAEMQRMINATLKEFQPVADTEDDDEEEVLSLLNLSTVSQLDTDDFPTGIYTAAMFDETASVANNNSGHPEEQLASGLGYSRPTENIATAGILERHAKRVWDSLAINLGDATKLLGQENQIKMDEINSMSKEKNRNYDLASNTLNKLAELVRAITDF